jgi:hypothetical protein
MCNSSGCIRNGSGLALGARGSWFESGHSDQLLLPAEDIETLIGLVFKRLNVMLKTGVYHQMELLDAEPEAFYRVHRQEAALLQRLGEKLCQRSLNS